MALHAMRGQPTGQTAASTDLDHVAEHRGTGRLTDDAGVQGLIAFGEPVEYLPGAVDRQPFFVAGDQQADRAADPGFAPVEISLRRGDKGGDRSLHVGGTAATQLATTHNRRKRIE